MVREKGIQVQLPFWFIILSLIIAFPSVSKTRLFFDTSCSFIGTRNPYLASDEFPLLTGTIDDKNQSKVIILNFSLLNVTCAVKNSNDLLKQLGKPVAII